MLIGRHDIDRLMHLDPASGCLPESIGQSNMTPDADTMDVELELSDLLINLRPVKQVK